MSAEGASLYGGVSILPKKSLKSRGSETVFSTFSFLINTQG